MYTPNTVFIPFFRAIDNCIKEVVNEHGFHEHGDDMIKVNESEVIINYKHYKYSVDGTYGCFTKNKSPRSVCYTFE